MASDDSGGREYDPDAANAFPDRKLNRILPTVVDDPEVRAFRSVQNVNAVTREGYNDHGPSTSKSSGTGRFGCTNC
jgi:metal-dependent HD superfamily phosphatase/phosphodiesterase